MVTIRSVTRKTPCFGYLVRQITKQAEPVIYSFSHMMFTYAYDPTQETFKELTKEFMQNSKYINRRSNSTYLFHETLCVSYVDQDLLTPEVLEDLTRKYLELRAPYAMAYCVVHDDTEYPHVHMIISANEIHSEKKLALHKPDFKGVRYKTEQYRRKTYPHMSANTRKPPAELPPECQLRKSSRRRSQNPYA